MSPLQNNYLVEIRFTWFSCEILVKIVLEVELIDPLVNRKATRHPSGFILFTCLYHFFFAFIKDMYKLWPYEIGLQKIIGIHNSST